MGEFICPTSPLNRSLESVSVFEACKMKSLVWRCMGVTGNNHFFASALYRHNLQPFFCSAEATLLRLTLWRRTTTGLIASACWWRRRFARQVLTREMCQLLFLHSRSFWPNSFQTALAETLCILATSHQVTSPLAQDAYECTRPCKNAILYRIFVGT